MTLWLRCWSRLRHVAGWVLGERDPEDHVAHPMTMMPRWLIWWSRAVERAAGAILGNRPLTPCERCAIEARIDRLNAERTANLRR